MNNFATLVSAVLILTGSAAQAQNSDAARYVNEQGIEVIQPRRSAAAPDSTAALPKASAVKKIAGPAPAGRNDSKMQVSVKEQLTRDEDRLTILTEELALEGKAFENKIKIMQTPAMKAKLSPEELTRLQETMVGHEKNMRALRAEIGRVRKS